MRYLNSGYFCCAFLLVLHQAAFADKEDKTDEISETVERIASNDSSSINPEGPPDSHEAMNNREINPVSNKDREKRSYEFLMGLINNNSNYQVTRVESLANLSKKPHQGFTSTMGANEIILELLVKIAANPDQWNKVHQILRQIDEDISISHKLLLDLHNEIVEESANEKKKSVQNEKKDIHKSTRQQVNDPLTKEVAISSDNGSSGGSFGIFGKSDINQTDVWPTFPKEPEVPKKEFKNKLLPSKDVKNTEIPKYPWQSVTESKSTYLKKFAYHRVTGNPDFINKSPKAYIAVSVIAPKTSNVRSKEDLILENELRQLKPWTHAQNLNNMASIRSRWIIQSDGNELKHNN